MGHEHGAKGQLFKWRPSADILVALATELWMISAYYVTTHGLRDEATVIAFFGVVTNLLVNVLVPLWWITEQRGQPLSELGITGRRWLPSLLASLGLAVFSSF